MNLKKIILVLLLFINIKNSKAQAVFTSDIQNFWIAFDSLSATSDTLKQLDYIQRLYIDKGTRGLHAFMEVRNFDAKGLLEAVKSYPKFWNSVRPATLEVYRKTDLIEQYVQKFKRLYPDYREAQIFYTITAVRAGGTTKDNMVLVGTEIAVGNLETEVSEFPDKRLENFFKTQTQDNIIPFTVHEYVHTQQQDTETHLLGQSIYEGACDFITELVLDTPLEHAYLQYGRANEPELKKQFAKDILYDKYENWLYNGSTSETVGDLGYFMGYTICKSYYKKAIDKKLAIKEIIELNYMDTSAVQEFLNKSGYYD